MAWYVYMVRCRDGSLYAGMTNDLEKRLEAHNAGKGAKYTRSKRPVRLAYAERTDDETLARMREAAIKAMSKAEKEELAAGHRAGGRVQG